MTATILAGAATGTFMFAAVVGASDPHDDVTAASLMLCAAVAAFAAMVMRGNHG